LIELSQVDNQIMSLRRVPNSLPLPNSVGGWEVREVSRERSDSGCIEK